MQAVIQKTEAWELSIHVDASAYDFTVKFVSTVPTARRPREETAYGLVLDKEGLTALRDVVDSALATSALAEVMASQTINPELAAKQQRLIERLRASNPAEPEQDEAYRRLCEMAKRQRERDSGEP